MEKLAVNNIPLVFIVCTGLGKVNRGYESFTRECFDALKSNRRFKLILLKGGGTNTSNEIVVPNLHRHRKITSFFANLFNLKAYHLEQFTFSISMLPLIIKKKPSVIYYSDFILGTYLWHLRRFFKLKYKLLFSNGAPNGPPFKTEDHVQQLLASYYDAAVREGTPVSKLTLLPYGFDINIKERIFALSSRERIRTLLGFDKKQKVILSVGAINKGHKRMDYLINEVAKLPDNYFLVILGQFEEGTPELLKLAEHNIPGRYFISSIPYKEVGNYYLASDYFVLASLIEGFGRVLIEAMSYGLSCIVHDYINSRQVLGVYGSYINMQNDGELSSYLQSEREIFSKQSLIEASYTSYSWDKLKTKYENMILKLVFDNAICNRTHLQ